MRRRLGCVLARARPGSQRTWGSRGQHQANRNCPGVSARSLHSTSRQQRRREEKGSSILSTISTFGNVLAAGTGTFASTLLALYLATRIENSAHRLLYEYCSEKYADIAEEDLPTAIKEREMKRRATGLAELNRRRGMVGEDVSLSLMAGLDGWIDEEDAEAMAESRVAVDVAGWQRRATQRRDDIILREEEGFRAVETIEREDKRSRVVQLDARRVQEDAMRRLTENLANVALTA